MTHDPTLDFLPGRFVAQKRLLLIALVMIVAAVVLRFVVIHRQENQLAALREEAKALGMPWTLEELNPTETIPDAENAATYYRQAFALRHPTAESFHDSIYDWPSTHLVDCPLFYYLGDNAASVNQAAFDAARKARFATRIDWGLRFATGNPRLLPTIQHYGECRTLATHLGDHAMLLQFRGQDREAIERWRDTIAVGAHLSNEESMVGQMVAMGVYALSLSRLQTMAPMLRADDPVVAAEVRKLIAELEKDETRFASLYPRGLHVEGPMSREWIQRFSENAWFLRPVFNKAAIEQSRTQLASFKQWSGSTVDQTDFGLDPGSGQRMLRVGEGRKSVVLGPLVHPHAPILKQIGGGYSRAAESRRRIRQEFRLTRVALAVRLFYVAEKRWPASIDELVPAYLPSVPSGVDSAPASRVEFAIVKNGRPDGADRPMIYVDFIGSANAPAMYREQYDWQMGQRSDGWDDNGRQWRDVTVWPMSACPEIGIPDYTHTHYAGFEASGLEPSDNSPAPNSDVYDPNAPGYQEF